MTESLPGAAQPPKQLPDVFTGREPILPLYHLQDGTPVHHERSENDEVWRMFGHFGRLAFGGESFEQQKGAIAHLYGHDLNQMSEIERDDFEYKIDLLREITTANPRACLLYTSPSPRDS